MPSFSQDITRFVEKTKLKGALVVKKLAFDAFRGVILRSPVDTGRFRASWRIGINSVDSTEFGLVSGGTIAADFGQVSKLEGVVWGGTVYITNSVNYALQLEHGSSRQAPTGVMLITFEQIKNDFARTVASIQ
jgi:hypothetical protein